MYFHQSLFMCASYKPVTVSYIPNVYNYKQQLHILFLATNAVDPLKRNVQVMRWALWIHLIYNYVSTLGPALQPSGVFA